MKEKLKTEITKEMNRIEKKLPNLDTRERAYVNTLLWSREKALEEIQSEIEEEKAVSFWDYSADYMRNAKG